MQCLHSVGFNAESLRDQIKVLKIVSSGILYHRHRVMVSLISGFPCYYDMLLILTSSHSLQQAVEMYHDWLDDDTIEDITLPALAELRGYWRGSLDASGGGNGDTMVSMFKY